MSSYYWDWESITRWGTSMSKAWRWVSTGLEDRGQKELKLEREVGAMS